MSMKKTMFASLLVMSISSAPLLANAGALTIVNNTNRASTSILNKNKCSTELGSIGITEPHTSSTVSDTIIKFACIASPNDCVADVYMTRHCNASGEAPVATLHFSTKTGIDKNRTVQYDNSYFIEADGFKVAFSGGPDLAAQK